MVIEFSGDDQQIIEAAQNNPEVQQLVQQIWASQAHREFKFVIYATWQDMNTASIEVQLQPLEPIPNTPPEAWHIPGTPEEKQLGRGASTEAVVAELSTIIPGEYYWERGNWPVWYTPIRLMVLGDYPSGPDSIASEM